MDNKIKVSIPQLNAQDIWIFSMYYSNRGLYGLFNILFTIACLYYLITKHNAMSEGQMLLLIFCAAMFTIIQPAMLFLKAAKQSKNETMSSSMELELDDEKMTVHQNEQTADFTWDQIVKTMIRPNMIIVYTSAVRAFIIPQRYWPEDGTKLKELLKEHTRIEKI